MKQRLCLARSLVHNPELPLLDEPASGLDPRARFEMKEILKNLGSMGKTIIISSHILPELADMCDTIGIMQKGKLIMHGTVEDIQLKAMHAQPLHVRVLEDKEKAVRILKEDPHTQRVSLREDYLVADYTGNDLDTAHLLQRLLKEDILIESYYKEKGNLETLFLELTSGQGGESGVLGSGDGADAEAGAEYTDGNHLGSGDGTGAAENYADRADAEAEQSMETGRGGEV